MLGLSYYSLHNNASICVSVTSACVATHRINRRFYYMPLYTVLHKTMIISSHRTLVKQSMRLHGGRYSFPNLWKDKPYQ
jgi:hypothetical protein